MSDFNKTSENFPEKPHEHQQIADRKHQHLNICNSTDVEATDRFTGFSEVSFIPRTLPELAWDDLNTNVTVWQRKFSAPFIISGMTFGIPEADKVNANLAQIAAHFNIPMGVGSQRIALRKNFCSNQRSTDLKKFGDIFLIANLGISHLSPDACHSAIEMISANALAIHMNVMQELLQPEGNRNFRNVLKKIEKIAALLPVPIIAKEVGFGVDITTAQRLFEAGVSAIDVGGKGGTSWSWIEGLRAENPSRLELARSFRNWGIPTAFNTKTMHENFPNNTIIATGGIRDGLTAAKALALGANLVGLGLPLMKAALKDADCAKDTMSTFIDGLKITMLATASKNVLSLKEALCHKHPYQ